MSEVSGRSVREVARGRPRSSAVLGRLVEAGLEILSCDDPSSLTIERVCHGAGVSRATFYRRWKSINPILAAIGVRLLEQIPAAPTHDVPVREGLERYAWDRAELLSDNRVGALFRYAFARAGHDADLRTLIQDLDRERNKPLIAFLRDAQGRGEIRADVSFDYTTHQLLGPIWHRTLLLQLPVDRAFVHVLVEDLHRSIGVSV